MIKSLSTVDTVHGPGLLHPFPNQQWSMVKGGVVCSLTVVRGTLTMVQ